MTELDKQLRFCKLLNEYLRKVGMLAWSDAQIAHSKYGIQAHLKGTANKYIFISARDIEFCPFDVRSIVNMFDHYYRHTIDYPEGWKSGVVMKPKKCLAEVWCTAGK